MNRFSLFNDVPAADAVEALTLERFAIGGPNPGLPTSRDLAEKSRKSAVPVDFKTPAGRAGIRVGASGAVEIRGTAFLSAVAESPVVRSRCAALADAADHAGSPGVREDETVGGNLCQRPRCAYFLAGGKPCLKNGGKTCFAIEGESKYHAIFGQQSPCRMVSSTNLGVALLVLNGTVRIQSATDARTIPAAGFFRMPTTVDPFRETTLEPGEYVSGISVGRQEDGWRSAYLQISERADDEWTLVSAAASLDIGPDNVIRDIRLALNAVAPVPWRLTRAEDFLRGKRADETNLREAARLALADAQPMKHNAYKVPIARALVARVIQRAGGLRA